MKPSAVIAPLLILSSFSHQTLAQPPLAPVRPVVDDYFGIQVTDPYRYMENLNNPEVQTWMKAQADHARRTFDAIPGRQRLLQRYAELDASIADQVIAVVRFPNDRYMLVKQPAKADVPKLYVQYGLRGKERLLVDPEAMSTDREHYSMTFQKPSSDGKYVAVGLAVGGSENTVMYVYDTDTGRKIDAPIDRARFAGVNWRPDNRSFFYNRLPKAALGTSPVEQFQKSRVYLHIIGTNPEQDLPVVGSDVPGSVSTLPNSLPFVYTSPTSRYALAVISGVPGSPLTTYVAPLDQIGQAGTPWQPVCKADDGVVEVLLHGDDVYLRTANDATRFKVIRTSAAHPDLRQAQTILPPSEAVIESMHESQDALYVRLQHGGTNRLLRIPFGGNAQPRPVALPVEGTINYLLHQPTVSGIMLTMTGWTRARAIYAYDPLSDRVTETHWQARGRFDRANDLDVHEVNVRSHDGVLVPLSIIHKRGMKRDGSNPVLLDGYGAYGYSIMPHYDPTLLAWYERGGIYAVAHVRGGGEYGEEWHRAGQKETKPNSWKDYIACAQYLIANRYTSPVKLTGQGASGGSLLVSKALVDHPNLFAALIANVGAYDLPRAWKMPGATMQIPEVGDFTKPDGFRTTFGWSTYHQVVDQTAYPAVLFTTGLNEARIMPWQSAKMAARLQAATNSRKPILLRIDPTGGHDLGVTKQQRRETSADLYSFLLWQTGHPDFQSATSQQASKK